MKLKQWLICAGVFGCACHDIDETAVDETTGDTNGDAGEEDPLAPCMENLPPDAVDQDGDSIPDACDLCPGFDDRLDEDGDSIPDACDRCPGFDDRLDEDGDSIPDACDPCLLDYRGGHADLLARYDAADGLALWLHGELEQSGEINDFAPEKVCVHIPYASYQMIVDAGGRPQVEGSDPDPFDPIGVAAGVGFWVLSANNLGPEYPFLGISTEGVAQMDTSGESVFESGLQFYFEMISMPIEAQLSIYQLPFLPKFFVSTLLPEQTQSPQNSLNMAPGGHDHYHWTFSHAGTYDVGVWVQGLRKSDGVEIQSRQVRLRFMVEAGPGSF